MLHLFRKHTQGIVITDTDTDEQHTITLIRYTRHFCEVRIDDAVKIFVPNDTFYIGLCKVVILKIDRGVKFGLDASRHIKIEKN